MRNLLALTLSLMLVAGGLAASVTTALAYTPDNEELTFLALINDYRGQHGLASLSLNMTLGEAADFHSMDMATTGYFEHTAPNGTTFDQNIRNFGYGGSTMGENIAAGMETASEAMVAWQSSPEHNAGMLNPNFTEIGIGRHYEPGSLYGWYWTTTFGGNGTPRGATEISNNGTGNNGSDRNRNNGSGNTSNDGMVQPADADTVLSEPEVNISEESGDGRTVETQQEVPATTNADGQTVSATDGSGPVNGDGQVTVYDDINTGGVSGDTVNYDQSVTPPTINEAPADQAAPPPAEQAPPVEQAPVEQAPAPETQSTTTTTTYQDSTGTVTDTFTSNIQEGDGNAREMGSNTNSSSTSGTVNTDNTTTTTTDPTVVSGPEAAPVSDEWVDPAANQEWVEPAPATEEWVDPAATNQEWVEPAPDAAGVDPTQAGMACGNYGTWYDAQTAYENAGGTAADPAFVNSLDPNWDGVACEEMMAY